VAPEPRTEDVQAGRPRQNTVILFRMRLWPRWFPHPALVFVVLAWGINFSVFKVVLRDLEPSVAALVRFVVMVVVLLVACRAMGIALKYPRGQFWRFAFAGFLANGVYMAVFVAGMRTAAATQAAIVLTTAPIWIATFAILLKQERFSWYLLIGGLVAFGGAVMTIVAGGGATEGSMVGALLVLLSAVIWAWSVVLMRPLVVDGAPFGVFALTLPWGAFALVPFGATATLATDWSAVSSGAWWGMGYLVVFAGIGAFAAYYKGLADVGPTKTGMTQFFIAPTVALFDWVVFRGPFVAMQAVGMAVVICGTLVASGRLAMSRQSAVDS
jgi:drug/metabolite transporter (DMT)-like permease